MGSFAVALVRAGHADPEVVKRMLDVAPHRGRAQDVLVHGHAVLGIARDDEVGGSSVARDDGLVAAVAGDLDNRVALTEELARQRIHVSGETAADTVIAAIRAWGDAAPERMRGSFACAVSDGTEIRFFRDQLGSQTLFLRDEQDVFLAASEAKQVLAGAAVPREPDLEAVRDIFYGRLGERRTALKGVERLPRASLATAGRTEGVDPRRYWSPGHLLETLRISVSEAQDRLAELLEQAVKRAVSGSDAIFLSGGVDSPTVAAFAAPEHLRRSGHPLTAISSVYPDQPAVDETHYIELVARHLGLNLHTFVERNAPLDDLAFWVDALDGPWDTLAIQEAAAGYRMARELGARTVLTGEMAEAVATMGGPLLGHLLSHGRIGAGVQWVRRNRKRGRSVRSLLHEAVPGLTPPLLASRYARLRRAHYRARQLKRGPVWIDPNEFGPLGDRPDFALPIRQRWPDAQLGPVGVPSTPGEEADDLCAARLGVQVRTPFADVDLWEFFLSLPAEVKFPDMSHVTKNLIRETMRGRLPDELLDRRGKTYFNDHVIAVADYTALQRWLVDSDFRMRGVDYDRLASRIERRDLTVLDILWAYDLARVHAYMEPFA